MHTFLSRGVICLPCLIHTIEVACHSIICLIDTTTLHIYHGLGNRIAADRYADRCPGSDAYQNQQRQSQHEIPVQLQFRLPHL